jgi:hypothetical protein
MEAEAEAGGGSDDIAAVAAGWAARERAAALGRKEVTGLVVVMCWVRCYPR